MFRKILAILLIAVFALTLVACAAPQEDAPPAQEAPPAEAAPPAEGAPPAEAAAPAETAPTREFEGVQLTLSAPLADQFSDGWTAALEEFTRQTGIIVTTDFLPWGQLRDRQTLELASGSGSYDVVYVHPIWWRQFANLGYIMPVHYYATDEDLADFIPSLLEMWRHDDGLLYGLPDWISSIMIAYRSDLFDEHGLSSPQNFDDIVNAARTLNSDEHYGIVFPAMTGAALGGSFVTALLANSSWVLDDAGNPNMDTPQALEVMNFFNDLSNYAPEGISAMFWEEVIGVVTGGRAAMAFMNTISIERFNDPAQSVVPDVWNFVPFVNANEAAVIDSWIWSVASDSANPEAAGVLVKWLAGAEAQAIMTSINRGTAGATFEFYENPVATGVLTWLPAMDRAIASRSLGMPDWETWGSEQDALESNMQRMFLGELTPEEVLEIVQDVMVENRR